MEVSVLGGGYAGVVLVRELEQLLPSDVEIQLFDATGTHLIQHEVHRLIRYPDLDAVLEIPLDEIFERAQVHHQEIVEVDTERRVFRTRDGNTHHPSYLAVSLGATTATFDLPGVETHGIPLKHREHAHTIRKRVFDLDRDQRVLIGGAGLSGVQVAGEIAALREDLEIVVIEQAERVAPMLPMPFSTAIHERLIANRIVVKTGYEIVAARERELVMEEGESLPYGLFVWTGGIGATPAMEHRPLIRSDLRIADQTYVLGDAARVIDDSGRSVPASAQTAITQAPVAARNINRQIQAEREGDHVFEPRLERYDMKIPGWVVSIGDDAVAQVDGTVVTGAPAMALKAAAGGRYLGSIGRVRESFVLIAEELGLPIAPAD